MASKPRDDEEMEPMNDPGGKGMSLCELQYRGLSPTKEQAERAFREASIAVWREIDRLMTVGPYPGIHMATDLRITEKLAWERYRYFLDIDKVSGGEAE